MFSRSLAVYQAPKWGSRIIREALVSRDTAGVYAVDSTPVSEIQSIGLFSVLVCTDGSSHAVLTAFLRLVDREKRANEQPQS
jgi:hypothetical protein